VKASIERFAQTATGTYRSLAAQIASIEVRDPLTAVLTLSQPWSGFPFTLANAPGMIVNTKLADAAGDAFGANPAGAGVGPFEFQSMTPGENIVLQGKQDYWGGPVCIDTLTFVPSLTEQGRYDAFETGEFGAAWMRDPKLVRQSDEDGIGGFTTYQNVQNVVLFNAGASASPANDVRVRQAVAHLVDQQSIAERVWDGAGNPTGAVIGENSAWYQDLAGPELDADAAAALIAEAKADGWDGKLRLLCPSSTQDLGITIESQLEAGGIDVELTITSDFNQHIQAVAVTKDFDLATWGMNILDDGLWATLNNNLNSASQGTNFGGYNDPNMDAALDDLRVAGTEDDTIAALAAVQAAWSATVPGVVLNAGPARTIHADDVHGIEPQGNLLVRFGAAYVD
jgi:peptide/nickel transport system substrate-binding protein